VLTGYASGQVLAATDSILAAIQKSKQGILPLEMDVWRLAVSERTA
jgi:hypothetical protein